MTGHGGRSGVSTPDPRAARACNLGTHAVYGLGLYLSAIALSTLQPGGRGDVTAMDGLEGRCGAP